MDNNTGIRVSQVLKLDKEQLNGGSDQFNLKYLEAQANCELLGDSIMTMKHFKTPTIGELLKAQRRMKKMQIKLEHNLAKLNRKILEMRLQLRADERKKKETNLFQIDIMSDYDISDL